jgi:hypothetical protein
MNLFNSAKRANTNQWKDMSLEFKLMFVYHGCMMVLFVTGDEFSVRQELFFAVLLLLALSSISTWHRRSTGWHWHGADAKHRLAALGSLVLTAVFLYAATSWFSPSNPRFLPWYLAGFGIGLFNFLQSLRLVHPSEAAFLADCGESASQLGEPAQMETKGPQWQRVIKTVFSVVFFLVWLEFLVFFYYSGKTFSEGSPVPTQTKTEPVTDHGKTAYIKPDQKVLRDNLELFGFIGIPSALLSGFLLHFVFGIKIFDNTPTLGETSAKKPGGS